MTTDTSGKEFATVSRVMLFTTLNLAHFAQACELSKVSAYRRDLQR